MSSSPRGEPQPQITVLDTGGQYTHLIARRVREQGVYADVQPSETSAASLRNRRGIIISGGPASVYEAGSPDVDPQMFKAGIPVLGICYGLQLIAKHLGGSVGKGDRGEYGAAWLEANGSTLLARVPGRQRIWMNHRDKVERAPEGFRVTGSTEACEVAAIEDSSGMVHGIQFHPEVVQTEHGREILTTFLFDICKCEPDWNPADRVPLLEEAIRQTARDRNVFFFVSGGVDSTVAYTLCLRALGPERVRGTFVDTGLMREGEREYVRGLFESLGTRNLHIADAEDRFLGALSGARDPEHKRRIIGEAFVSVQEEILSSGHYLDGHWVLGQGTIYPDTIESGGTAKADLIKTHHNRVAGIQKLIDSGRIIEPLSLFYKDEVREVGRELGLPDEFLERHPFPGPGLAIRCLCSERDAPLEPRDQGWLVPVHSVGVQGDSRSYRPVLAVQYQPGPALLDRATTWVNQSPEVNRVIALLGTHEPLENMSVHLSVLNRERIERLRKADAAVRAISSQSGFDRNVWQFPVILIPVGNAERRDSIVLRPVDSVDGMTAQSVELPDHVAAAIVDSVLAIEGVCGVFLDLTHKPPGTIEWE